LSSVSERTLSAVLCGRRTSVWLSALLLGSYRRLRQSQGRRAGIVAIRIAVGRRIGAGMDPAEAEFVGGSNGTHRQDALCASQLLASQGKQEQSDLSPANYR